MSYTDKITVLDMIIETLQEHEVKLDDLVYRMESVADRLSPQKHDPEGPVSEAELSRRFYEPLGPEGHPSGCGGRGPLSQ